jgi:Pentapeptide repeats (8 copies)
VLSIVVLGGKGWRAKGKSWPDDPPERLLLNMNPGQYELAEMLWEEHPRKREENRAERWKGLLRLVWRFVRSLWPFILCFLGLSFTSYLLYNSKYKVFRIDISYKVISQVIAADGHSIVSGADLKGIDLRNADASGAYLWGADLRDVDFTDANLTEADISGCDLRGSKITPAQIASVKTPDPHNPPRLPYGMKPPWK